MPILGERTGCDLGDVTPLFMPWQEIHHLLRPAFSQNAASLSLELAAAAYQMQTASWRAAGWHDITYQVDNRLLTGASVNGETEHGFSENMSNYYQRMASSLVRNQSPISQLRGALRQRESSDTCKSLIMIHSAAGGRYVVAIGFMGTGKRIYDWFSNFRMDEEEGMHKGFLQLTREFEANCAAIEFPETAKELKKERLSLADILMECRRPDSRFDIWLAGHSQGGAVLQLFALRLVRRGLLRQHLIGYGFASPGVLFSNPGVDLSSIPLYHIFNADDPTPRAGAPLHVGRCRIYQPDEAMRSVCYGSAWQSAAFREALRQLALVRDNKTVVLNLAALLYAIKSLPDQETAEAVSKIFGQLLPGRLLSALGGRVDRILQYLIRRTEITYSSIADGASIPANYLKQYERRISRQMSLYGAQPYIRAMLQAMYLPHRLCGKAEGVASYQYITARCFADLKPHLSAGAVPKSASQPRRGARAYPAGRYHPYSRRRNRSVLR